MLVAKRIGPNQSYLLLFFFCWGFFSLIRSFISLPLWHSMSELLCSLNPCLTRSESLQITHRMPGRLMGKRGIFQFLFILLSRGEAHFAHSVCKLLGMDEKSRKHCSLKKREQGAEPGWSLGWSMTSSPLPGCLSSTWGPKWCSNLSFCWLQKCCLHGLWSVWPIPSPAERDQGDWGSWGGRGATLLEEAEPLGAHEGADQLPASTSWIHFQLHPSNSSFSFIPVSHGGVDTWGFLPNYSSL